MASGKAIVGANTGAIPEILGDSGLLANPLNAKEIASEIGLLLNAPEERYRLGSLARHRAEMAFGMPQHLDALVKIYCPA